MAYEALGPLIVLVALSTPALIAGCAADHAGPGPGTGGSSSDAAATGAGAYDSSSNATSIGAGAEASSSNATSIDAGPEDSTTAPQGDAITGTDVPTTPGDAGAADEANPMDADGGSMAPGDAADSAEGGGDGAAAGDVEAKPRVIVITDIGFDPDDRESLVRYMVYSNEFDTEALIAGTSIYLRSNPREDLIRQVVTAYGQARTNLLLHASGFPDPASLLAVTKTGQAGLGMAFVGAGKGTAGSQQLIAAVDKPDARPVWVTIWGGANTLAQALTDVSASRSAAALASFVAKLRVYSISDQDDAGAWIRKTFPHLFYIVSPSDQSSASYARATWSGISGDRWYKNGPMFKFDLVDTPWLQTNISMNHGPLGAAYPDLRWIMEGDTPSWMGLIDNGLGWAVSPSYGGWGGRYTFLQPSGEPQPIWTNDSLTTRDTVAVDDGGTATSDQATIWRWREHFQYDFAARMNWCVADQFSKANHNPRAVLNGDTSTRVLTLPVKGGSSIALSAVGTSDPDGDALHVTWWIYAEAGSLGPGASLSAADGSGTSVSAPAVTRPGALHVIMQVEDSGNPHLFSYRRAVLNVTP